MKKVDLSIIILSYNTKKLLENCLQSVIKNSPPKTEIIIVDNGSTDGSKEFLRDIKLKRYRNIGKNENSKSLKLYIPITLKIILNEKNLGFARGNNQAIRYALGKFVFFLNSDTIIKDGAVEKLAQYLIKHPDITAVSPLLLNEDGTIQKDPCYLKFPSPLFTFVYYNKFLRKIADRFFPKIIYSTTNFEIPTEVDQLSGAALMIRKDIFEKIGRFDESFEHFFEDVDLSWRLKNKGYKLLLLPSAKIIHFGGKSLESKVKKEGIESFYYLNFKGLFRFCEKNYTFWRTLFIKIIIFLNLLARLRFNLILKLYFSQ